MSAKLSELGRRVGGVRGEGHVLRLPGDARVWALAVGWRGAGPAGAPLALALALPHRTAPQHSQCRRHRAGVCTAFGRDLIFCK
ncbi:hypothetical protein RR46_06774 [Papilio xuthus]|uniref:Uncharacterized protein n=1 Tax=Papilio xuthus TaxID=66420 RepID=A0A194PY12_PAPXU|nr:hypothetical protein RR46_06774 [Papilio xuthus]